VREVVEGEGEEEESELSSDIIIQVEVIKRRCLFVRRWLSSWSFSDIYM
jgi:hypothetical protein